MINKIRNTALAEMPDVLNKIDLNKINIEEKPETIKAGFNFRRALLFSMSAFVLVISAFLVYNFVLSPNTTDLTPLSGETELIGFQTVSAASMLDISAINPVAYSDSATTYIIPLSTTISTATTTEMTTTTSTPSTDVQNQLSLINSYMNMMETVIGSQDQMVYQSVTSDNPDYAYALEFKSTDLNGNLIQYKMYYNKTLNGNDYIIDGIMIANENQFSFTGRINSKNQNTDTEFTAYIDSQNYVQVRNMSTNQNQVFAYKIVQNNQVYNESTVSIKSQQYSIQATVQTQNNNEDMNLTIQKNTSDNGNTLNISYNISNQGIQKSGQFQVGLTQDHTTGKYVYAYHFSDTSQVITEHRSGKGNSPATPADFQNNMHNSHGKKGTTTTDTQTITSSNDGGSVTTNTNPNVTTEEHTYNGSGSTNNANGNTNGTTNGNSSGTTGASSGNSGTNTNNGTDSHNTNPRSLRNGIFDQTHYESELSDSLYI